MTIQDQGGGGGPQTNKKGIWGWMFFDWAAQPFFTVVTTFIFGPYVVSRMVENPAAGQAAWATSIAVAGIFIALLSPVLGSIADKTGPRKPWIGIFAILKIGALLCLWFSAPGSSLTWVLTLFIIATVAAEFSIVFNDSMMSHVVPQKDIGRVSNTAWGLGYAGGMIVLIMVLLFMAASPDSGKTLLGNAPILGLDPAKGEDARVTTPFAALWYFVFILPMFFFTPDKADTSVSFNYAVKEGLSELKDTYKEVRERAGVFKFLIARMIYQDGLSALLALGGIFAAGMFAWQTTELGIFGILLNIVAIPSCIIAGRLDIKFGTKRIIMICIILLIFATLGVISTGPGFTLYGLIQFEEVTSTGLFSTPAEKAYIFFCLFIGVAFGPIQASSRSYLAKSVLPEESGRYFGLYALVGRATSFVAPAMVGAITAITDSQRAGMSVIIVFLVVGMLIMATAPRPRENRAIVEANQKT